MLRHVQIGRYVKVTQSYRNFKFPIISLFEHFPLLRHVQIRSYLKVTLGYRVLSVNVLIISFVCTVYPAATFSEWMLPEIKTGLQRLKVFMFR